jgi:hypothetical protein
MSFVDQEQAYIFTEQSKSYFYKNLMMVFPMSGNFKMCENSLILHSTLYHKMKQKPHLGIHARINMHSVLYKYDVIILVILYNLIAINTGPIH